MDAKLNDKTDYDLLLSFNNRCVESFSEVYKLYYDEFYFLAKRLFYNTELHPDDVVQDIFINLWEHKSKKFDTLSGLKLFIYVCIKNRLRNYYDHKKHIEKHRHLSLLENKFSSQVAETEIFSIITHAIHLLPAECAKVFKLHIDGWEIKDIASSLQKSESTVYKQRQEAISILKKKLTNHNFEIIFLFFS